MARYGHLFLIDVYVLDPAREDPTDSFMPRLKQMLREEGRGAICIQVRSGSKPPPDDTRSKILEFLRAEAAKLVAVVVVLEGSGFWLAAFRALMGTLITAARVPVKIQICSSASEAAALLEARDVFVDGVEAPAMKRFYAEAPERF